MSYRYSIRVGWDVERDHMMACMYFRYFADSLPDLSSITEYFCAVTGEEGIVLTMRVTVVL